MSKKFSIWTSEGRLERLNRKVGISKLEQLKQKRIRQIKKLIEKLKTLNLRKSRRFEQKLAYLGN